MKTPETKRTTRRIAASLAIVLALAAAQSALAAQYWTGNISTTWDDAGNWNGSDGHFYIQPVAEDKMLCTIDNDNCEGYQTHLYCGTEEKPFVFSNSGTFTAVTQFDIGYINNKSGAALFQGGKFNIGTLLIGNEATIGKDASEGYLKLDSTALTITASANLNNGKLVANNSTFTCKDMNAGGTNGVVTIEKNSGDWTFSGTPKFGTATGSVVRVYHRGGSMTSGYMDVGIANVLADVEFEISGGVITNTIYAAIRNDNKMTVKDGGKLVGSRSNNDVALVVGANGTAGELNIIDGGEVSVPNRGVCLCYNASAKATVNISNGGALTARNIWVRNNTGSAATINLDGGIIRATVDYADFINAYDKLHIYVGMNGGTFDTAGHNVTIAEDLENKSGETGCVRFAGGGTATLSGAVSYTGVTYVDAGTKLVATTAAEKTNILKNGLEMIGTPTLGTAYTIFASSAELTEDDLANVKCRMASNPTIALSEDNLSIVVTVDALQAAYWTGSAGDNNLSTPGNWSDGVVPTSGNPTIYSFAATTLTVGDTFRADSITIPEESAVVTIGAGDLHLAALTNAYKLAIASGASLTIDGDLVLYKASGTALYSNEGTVIVKGDVDFQLTDAHTAYYQYEVVTDATMPIIAGGLAYNGEGSKYLTVYLGKDADSSRAGQWVIGAKGLHYKSSRNIWHTGFMMGQGVTTLSSSSDWSLASSGRGNSTRDLGNYYDTSTDIKNSSLVLDTNNYTNNAISHTITLNGRLISSATTDPAVTIKGAGTVVVNTSEGVGREGYQKTSIGTTLAVTDTATLKINAGKSIVGEGKVSLAAGTTLALDSGALGRIGDTEFTPCFPGLALPETGTATLRIDGSAKLRSGDYVLLNAVPANYANLAVDCTTAAIAGRKASVVEKNGQLVLDIESTGAMVIIY